MLLRGLSAALSQRFYSTVTLPGAEAFKHVITEKEGRIGIVRLNRPPLNPLNDEMLRELGHCLEVLDDQEDVGAIILTGNEKAFAAGADIKYMSALSFVDSYKCRLLNDIRRVDKIRTPIIGVVRGYALGGGCELAMQCDILLAGESARFGQPEVTIGTIPGAGGTQRLIRAIGKSRAMQMILTGEQIDARQAADWGMVSSVHPDDKVFEEGMRLAKIIAGYSKPIQCLAKEATNLANETTLATGLILERKMFESTFGTEDKMEGMGAFSAKPKRIPVWKHK